MKTTLKYAASFTIPQELSHRGPKPGEDATDWDHDIFSDDVSFGADGSLALSSRRGTTTFPAGSWVEKDDHFVVAEGTEAAYNGAHAAMNAVWGIEFPQCAVGAVESSYGSFGSVEEYEAARLYHRLCKGLHQRFFRQPVGNDQRSGGEILQKARATTDAIDALLKYEWHVGTCAQRDGTELDPSPLVDLLAELRAAAGFSGGYVSPEDDAAIVSVIFNREVPAKKAA